MNQSLYSSSRPYVPIYLTTDIADNRFFLCPLLIEKFQTSVAESFVKVKISSLIQLKAENI